MWTCGRRVEVGAAVVSMVLFLTVLCKDETSSDTETRYIFYDVNPGEGFNLRRDVFVRVAVFVKKLNQAGRGRFVLVLPPWGPLYHWQTRDLGDQSRIPWRDFFDVDSVSRYVPAVDLDEYLGSGGNDLAVLDEVLYLQNYKEGWKNGHFEEKHDFRECLERTRYRKEEEGDPEEGAPLYRGWFWGHGDRLAARRHRCLSVQGSTYVVKELVLDLLREPGSSLVLDRAEQLLHDWFGDEEYWAARRSMRFSRRLTEVAAAFRRETLGSEDDEDATAKAPRWEDHQPKRGSAVGGPYLCVHLRRKDYVVSRRSQIPTVEGAARQASRKASELGLKKVFLSTDAPAEEKAEFKKKAEEAGEAEVVWFSPENEEERRRLKDGGAAIVDQIVCSHARHLLGSTESTFTFRIQEEREIMGFSVESTFNMLCPDGDERTECRKPSIWKIKYPESKNRAREEL